MLALLRVGPETPQRSLPTRTTLRLILWHNDTQPYSCVSHLDINVLPIINTALLYTLEVHIPKWQDLLSSPTWNPLFTTNAVR